MKKALFILLLISVTGCTRSVQRLACETQWVVCPPTPKLGCQGEPNEDDCLDLAILDDHGERYTRRDDYSEDISQFRPKKSEPYESYFARVMNTLSIQEYNTTSLQEAIKSKKEAIEELDSQLQTMLESEVHMRLALSMYENGEENPKKNKSQKNHASSPPFSVYVIQKDDTLQKIAKQAFGTHTGWLAIYRFNLKKMPYGPNQLEEGDKLFIPNIYLTTPLQSEDLLRKNLGT